MAMQQQQNTEPFPPNGNGNGHGNPIARHDDDERKNRFLNFSPAGDDYQHHQYQQGQQAGPGHNQPPHHHHQSQARAARATSQPPHTSDQSFLSSPIIPSSLGRTNSSASPVTNSSPWPSSGARMGSSGRSPGMAIPTRSSSFSTSAQTNFSSAMRESQAFDSTFEDDEGEYDTYDDRLLSSSFTSNNPRGRTYNQDPARSRSQSLATNIRQGPIGSNFLSSGISPGGMWGDSSSLSNPLNIPIARYGEYKPPGSSRYGSLGALGRSPINMTSPNGYSNRGQTIDASNMSPFVRDVDSILLDEGSAFRELWAGMNPPKDEIGGGGGSGTTSRRHSVSVVQPRRGANVVGFNAPDNDGPDEPPRPSPFHQSSFGRGGLMLSDDDLASDLGLLNLGPSSSGAGGHASASHHHPPSQPASLPIYAPLSHLAIPGGANSLSRRSPSDMSGSGGSPTSNRYDLGDQFGTTPLLQQQQLASQQMPQQGASAAARFIPGQGIFSINGSSSISISGGTAGGGQDIYHRTRAPSYSGSATSPLSPSIPNPQAPPHHFFSPPQPQQMTRRLSEASSLASPTAGPPSSVLSDLGKGVPLHAVLPSWPLYIVEFKAGRTDLFYVTDLSINIHIGDLVIVEADRGKDLGKVVNDTITLLEVEAFQRQQVAKANATASGGVEPTSPGGSGGGSGKREINPKRIYCKAQAQDTQLLLNKVQDEQKALQLCQSKVRAKKLPMEVVDAEYQWDRRKLTFYFTAEKRIDFRELVRELFRLYKTRIWMASLQPGGGINYEQ